MADALLKAGKITEEQVARAEKESRRAESEKSHGKEFVKEKPPENSPEEFKPFDGLWFGEKSNAFVRHLIYNFVPYSKAEKIWSIKDNLEKHCCICRREIISCGEAAEIVGETAGDNMHKRIKFEMENEDRLDDSECRKEYAKMMEEMGREMFGDRKLGYQGENTKKVICMPCYSIFYDWVMARLLTGNREISAIVNKVVRQEHSIKGGSHGRKTEG